MSDGSVERWIAASGREFFPDQMITDEGEESKADLLELVRRTRSHAPSWIGRAVYFADGRREMRDVEEWPAKPAVTVSLCYFQSAIEPMFACYSDWTDRERAEKRSREFWPFSDFYIRERRVMSNGTTEYGEPERVLALPGAEEDWISGTEESDLFKTICRHNSTDGARDAWSGWRSLHKKPTLIARRLVQREGGRVVRILIDSIEEVRP